MQIVQELCRRPSLNQTCFDMPTIYIETQSNKPKDIFHINTIPNKAYSSIESYAWMMKKLLLEF